RRTSVLRPAPRAPNCRTFRQKAREPADPSRLAAAYDQADARAPRSHVAGTRALPDHSADAPRVLAPDAAHRAMRPADLRPRTAEGEPDHAGHAATDTRRPWRRWWWRRRWRRRRRRRWRGWRRWRRRGGRRRG